MRSANGATTRPYEEPAPHDLEAERAVLGAILLSSRSTLPVALREGLRAADFYRSGHALIFDAMTSLHERGAGVDQVTVIGELRARGHLERAGGESTIAALPAEVPAAAHIRDYAKTVRELAFARRVREQALLLAADPDEPSLIDAMRRALDVPRADVAVAELLPGSVILENQRTITAVWGEGDEVLWASGEPLMIAAPQGLGKTTIAQQLILRRAGIRSDDLLGYPVTADERRTLYIAADRPRQALRSFRRMVGPDDLSALDTRLRLWRGPLPFSVANDPSALAAWLTAHDVGTVCIDSLKDIAMPLSDDAVGSAVNLAVQHAIAAGVEVLLLHHDRKRSQDNANRQPSLDNVYGSTWLTAGCGSVLALAGEPGNPDVTLHHLKQPGDVVGPLDVVHDHETGTSSSEARRTVREILAGATNGGFTAKETAVAYYKTIAPTKAQVEKMRRRLDQLVREGAGVRVAEEGQNAAVRYRPVDRRHGEPVKGREGERDGSRGAHADPETPMNTRHGALTEGHARQSTPPPPLKGGRAGERAE